MKNSKDIVSYTKELSILFVEDHDELRESTTDILSTCFKTVASASNGEEGFKCYNEFYKKTLNYYDIVLSDIQMPRLNGIELTEKIYAINPFQTVVILSAHDDSKYLLPLINLGIEQFIKKPINYDDLLDSLLYASIKIREPDKPTVFKKSEKIQLSTDYFFDKGNSSLFQNQENIYLTKYEIIFLQLLVTSVGKIYSNEDIVAYYLNKGENIDSQNIRKLVSKLRKKVADDCLESVYGVGYRLVPYRGV